MHTDTHTHNNCTNMYIYLFVAKVQCPKAGRTEGLTLTEVHGKGGRGELQTLSEATEKAPLAYLR